MTALDLAAIKARQEYADRVTAAEIDQQGAIDLVMKMAYEDVPALLAEIDRLQVIVAEHDRCGWGL